MPPNRDPERGERIKQLRKGPPYRGTQKAIAQKIGVTERNYQYWEKGHNIEDENLAALAHVLKTTPEFILTGDPADATPPQRMSRSEASATHAIRVHDRWAQSAIRGLSDRLDRLERAVANLQDGLGDLAAAMRELRVEVAERRTPPPDAGQSESPDANTNR
jgi:transcriptional regulator with XRE-family HTH domain